MVKVFNRPVKLAGHEKTVNDVDVQVLEYDGDTNILLCSGTTVPADGSSGFAKGCLFIKTDESSGYKGVYHNKGTTSSAAFVSKEHVETATGTYTLTNYGATKIDSSGGAVTGTLGSGSYIGQLKTIVMTEASNSSTVSITNHETSDPEVATFDAVDEYLLLVWTGTEWATVSTSATFV